MRAHGTGKLSKVQADSAGLYAQAGVPASKHAITIANEWGSSLKSHRSRQLHKDDVEAADWICVMTPEHAAVLWQQFPQAASRILLLGDFVAPTADDEQLARLLGEEAETVPSRLSVIVDVQSGVSSEERSILDPYGGSREAYNACAAQIERAIKGLAKVLAPAETENDE